LILAGYSITNCPGNRGDRIFLNSIFSREKCFLAVQYFFLMWFFPLEELWWFKSDGGRRAK
jgi:hypothetical protein